MIPTFEFRSVSALRFLDGFGRVRSEHLRRVSPLALVRGAHECLLYFFFPPLFFLVQFDRLEGRAVDVWERKFARAFRISGIDGTTFDYTLDVALSLVNVLTIE